MPEQLVGPREFDRDQAIARNERIAEQTGSPGLGGRRLTWQQPERERTAGVGAFGEIRVLRKNLLEFPEIQAT